MPSIPEPPVGPSDTERYLVYMRMRDAANRLVAEYATRDRNGDPTALAALVALRERTIAVDLSNLEAQLAATREFVDDRTRLHGERDV